MAAADNLRQSLSSIGCGDSIEERTGLLIAIGFAGIWRKKEWRQRLRPRQFGTIGVVCRRPELVMPLISRDFAAATDIDAVQAHTVDLGDYCAIVAKHQSPDDDRATSRVKHGDMTPTDAFAAAVETDTLRFARYKDTLTVLIRLLSNGREGDLKTRIEQRRVHVILAQLGPYRRRHGDASECFIFAGPCLGDPLEGRPIDQAASGKSTIEVHPVDALSHTRLDRVNGGKPFRSAPRQRQGTGNCDRGQGGPARLVCVQSEGALFDRQRDLDRWLGTSGNYQRPPDLEGLDLDPIAIAGRQNRGDSHLDICRSRQDRAGLDDVIGEPGKLRRIETVLPDPVDGRQTLAQKRVPAAAG